VAADVFAGPTAYGTRTDRVHLLIAAKRRAPDGRDQSVAYTAISPTALVRP